MSPRFQYKTKFERQKYNTMIVYLKKNNLSLCLNHEHLKSVLPKNILITENYVHSRFCWYKFHQNRTRIDFGIMFPKIVVLYEIYSKKITVTEYFWHVTVH